MYGLKGALRAKLQDRLPHNASRTRHEQFKGWKPVLPFHTLAKYRLFTSMAHDSTHCSYIYVLWVGCWYGWRESNTSIKLYSELNMKISAQALFERKQGRTAKSWFWILYILSFITLENQNNTSGYLFSSCRKLEWPVLSFTTNIKKKLFLFQLISFGILDPS